MMALDHVFPEVARRESRAVETVDRAGTRATFLFREFYCTEPGCDCRRVILYVHWVEGSRVAATIGYGFEPSRRRDEPQISLDPFNPQSARSEALLALFTDMIASDAGYRNGLRRRYALMKQAVDDPTHPDHRKVRGEEHDDPSFRPAFPRRKKPVRGGESIGGGPNKSPQVALVAAKVGRSDGKLQQRFRQMVEKVDRLRQRVQAWKERRPDIDREVAAYVAAMERQRGRAHEMVVLLDRSYANAAFNKADRKQLAELICSVAGELLEDGGHDDLKPIYSRHRRSDFEAEAGAVDAASAEALKAMMEMFGVEFDDADVSSIDKLAAYTAAQAQELDKKTAAAEERRGKRKKSARQVAAETTRDDERRRTHKAMQDVYRGLAMALHPDREQDPAERRRKTELMREVNVAYEAKDLLRLLELELELERVDRAQVEAIAEDRLRRFNQILAEQARQLAVELDELELPFRMDLGLAPSARLAPDDVLKRIRGDIRDVEQRTAALVHDLAAFQDLRGLKAWLKADRRRGPAVDDLDLFA